MKIWKIAAAAAVAFLLYTILKRKSQPPQYFTLSNINSRGTPPPPELQNNAQELADQLNIIQDELFKIDPSYSVSITSSYRTPSHNADVGGVQNSWHLQAKAVDFKVQNMPAQEVHRFIMNLIDNGVILTGGVGQMANATHYDTGGTKKTWGYTTGSGSGTYGMEWKTAPATIAPAGWIVENSNEV